MSTKKSFRFPGGLCLYCNIDSEELKAFLIVVIGGLVLASIFVAAGAWMKGFFKDVEDPQIKGKVLKLEEIENER